MSAIAKAFVSFAAPILGLFLVFHPWTEPDGPGPYWMVILPLIVIAAILLNPFWWLVVIAFSGNRKKRPSG
jgi:hypothetical protein